MTDSFAAAGAGQLNLNLTAEEKRVYGQLLKEADPDGFGAVSGDVAVKFFEKTRLSSDVLGQIWQIADAENRGFLEPSGFGVVLRLIGHAQAGRNPIASLATQPAPLPRFDGMAQPVSAQSTGTPASPTQGAAGLVRVPALTPDKVAEYSALFEKSGAENGMLSGLVAKQIFERARLSNEVLGQIWGLADTQGRGALDVTEFVIAMHLLASSKSGAMRGVPNSLPPGLFGAAARRPPPRMGSMRPGSASGPSPGVFPQNTGFNQRPQSPLTRFQAGPPLSAQTSGDWAVTAADKARFDSIFGTIDKQGLGYINGEQAVEFFGNARLPEEVLAQIWDLSDIDSEGKLDKDEFAVAMYLIRQQRGSRDGRGILPSALPPALVPPSRRRQQIQPSQPTAPAFENAPVTQPRSAAEDLFGLDVMAPTQPVSQQIPQSTGGTDTGPFANPKSPIPGPAAPSSVFKPFEPSSTFGRSLGGPPISSPAQNRAAPAQPSIPESEDLLGDADQAVSSRLTNETAELGNLSNQVGNLSKQMTELQGNRRQSEQELGQINHQKSEFEKRLAQLRAAYEQEAQEYRSLQERLTTSRNETKRLQQDMAMIEGSHTDLSTQHVQLRTALEADQRENASLKERMRQINSEIEQLKPQIEKIKSEARQQKGLVAINKKQLSQNESERDRLKSEAAAAAKEVEDATREIEETTRQIEASKVEVEAAREAALAAAAAPKPAPPPAAVASPPRVASPAASISSNPFMRRGPDATFSPPMGSPEPINENRSAFDNIFGPSFGGSATATTAMPSTSFRNEPPTITREISSGTSTPQVVEPPAPPPSKQITSDALPLRVPMERQESVTSSVNVAPPVSARLSPADTPRAGSPAVSTRGDGEASTLQPKSSPFGAAAPEEEQQAARRAIEDAAPTGEIPGAFPGADTPRTGTPFSASSNTGATTGAAAATQQVQANTTNTEEKAPTQNDNFDAYFGGPAHQRTPSEQVKDFDDAFASMKDPKLTAAISDPSKEFPDIQEIDDEESSSDEEAPLGFDDDFNAKSSSSAPLTASKFEEPGSVAAGKQPEIASAVPGHLQVRPQLETASSSASSLPGFEQQKSPPTYKDSVPQDNPSHFPPEYKGLLPEREDPTSPPLAGGSTAPIQNPPAGSPPAYGPEAARSQDEALSKVASQAAASDPKPAAFDFDSVFANLGAPQAEDDDSDDADATFGSRRNQPSEFDPTFDSPAQSRAATAPSITQSPTAHHSVTNGVAPATGSGNGAGDNFFSFNDSVTTRETARPAAGSPVSHDWDALFAPLNSSSATEASNASPAAQTTAISPDQSAHTTAVPVADSGPVTPLPPAAPVGSLKGDRPQPGRALSAGTEHDDPILKRLTSMGWSRADSLAALEKYDYNIDKAADYLTFQS